MRQRARTGRWDSSGWGIAQPGQWCPGSEETYWKVGLRGSAQLFQFLREFGNLRAQAGDACLALDLVVSFPALAQQFVQPAIGNLFLGLVHSVDDHPNDEVEHDHGPHENKGDEIERPE